MASARECFDEAKAILRPTVNSNPTNAALYDIAAGLHNMARQISDVEDKLKRIENNVNQIEYKLR